MVLARFLTRTHGRMRNRLLLTTSGRCVARVASSHPIHASRLAIRHAGLENCTQATTRRCGVGARIDEHVYIGPHCDLGLVHIEHDAMIAAGVHIPSGAYTHGIDVSHRPMREQPGLQRLVRIGAGAWIGNNAVVMADVGEDSIVGAGAVVTRPIPPRTVVAGVPARVIRSRESTVQLESAPGNAGSPPTSRT